MRGRLISDEQLEQLSTTGYVDKYYVKESHGGNYYGVIVFVDQTGEWSTREVILVVRHKSKKHAADHLKDVVKMINEGEVLVSNCSSEYK